ncbi:hypothetical protein [Roseiterribacter gracilis]|uniref:Uncharacterized protein n=1 Tax=Roseiterribacter gracilis TaxID=2812848 RepID=A0A8S8XHT5_9PROT|nr:hypothetical protein TMPK1_38180 [Rhodospirillales bacterium TMPK1]
MPTEIRHIICNSAEVISALQLFYKTRQKPLPAGSVVSLIIQDEPLSAVLEIEGDKDGKRMKISCGGEEMAAALILFCRESHIPLPADGQKVLQKFGDSVGLIVTRNPRDKAMATKLLKR